MPGGPSPLHPGATSLLTLAAAAPFAGPHGASSADHDRGSGGAGDAAALRAEGGHELPQWAEDSGFHAATDDGLWSGGCDLRSATDWWKAWKGGLDGRFSGSIEMKLFRPIACCRFIWRFPEIGVPPNHPF